MCKEFPPKVHVTRDTPADLAGPRNVSPADLAGHVTHQRIWQVYVTRDTLADPAGPRNVSSADLAGPRHVTHQRSWQWKPLVI